MSALAAVVKQGITPGVQLGIAGSSPASRSNRFSLSPIDKNEARVFLSRWHYKHNSPNGRYYAGFDNKGLAAVAVVKGPSGGRGQKNSSRLIRDGFTTKELSRLALRDDCPKNSESMFLAQLASAWRSDGIDLMLAYADPVVGHVGLIYRASNWIYLGRTYYAYATVAFFVDGGEVSYAGLRKLGGTDARILYMRNKYGSRFELRRAIPKHVYMLPLNRRARKEVKSCLEDAGDAYDRRSGSWGWFTPRGRSSKQSAMACACVYVTGSAVSDCPRCLGKLWLWSPLPQACEEK